MNELSQLIILTVFPALVIFAAMYDILTMTIPNRISLALIAAFGMCALWFGIGWTETATHIGMAFLVLAVGIVFFARGWVGGGDVKLAAATTLWLGLGHVLEYLFIASLIGGVLTVLILALRRFPLPGFARNWVWLNRLHDAGNGVPYGVALAIGGIIVFPGSPLWEAAFPG